MKDSILDELMDGLNEKELDELLEDITIGDLKEQDINKEKIKENTMKSINNLEKRKFLSKGKIAVAALVALALIGLSPIGEKVMASIGEKLYFIEGRGLVKTSENQQIYVLKEPIETKVNDENIMVRNIVSYGNSIEISVIGYGKQYDTGKSKVVSVKTKDGKELKRIFSGGGANEERWKSTEGFSTNEQLKEVELFVLGEKVGDITLNTLDGKDSYGDIGDNKVNKNILIGGNSFNCVGKSFVSIWSNKDDQNSNPRVDIINKNDVEIKDSNNNLLSFDYSKYEQGTTREFQLEKVVKEPLTVTIKGVNLSYNFDKPIKVEVDIPKEGEEITLNKEVAFPGLDEKIIFTKISKNHGEITLVMEPSKGDRTITDLMFSRKGYGGSTDREAEKYTYRFKKEDLSTAENLSKKLKLEINRINLYQKGSWEFKTK